MCAHAGLQRGVGKFRILNSENQRLHLFERRRGEGECARISRQGMEAEDRARDDAERAERAGREFWQVVAGDILDDFAAAGGQSSIGQSKRDTNDEITQRAETKAQTATVVDREHATHRSFFRPEGIKSKPLTVLGEGVLQFLDRAARFDGYGEVDPSVLEDFVQAGGRKNQVGSRGWVAPSQFCATSAGDDRETHLVCMTEDGSKFLFSPRLDNEARLNTCNGIFGNCRTKVVLSNDVVKPPLRRRN